MPFLLISDTYPKLTVFVGRKPYTFLPTKTGQKREDSTEIIKGTLEVPDEETAIAIKNASKSPIRIKRVVGEDDADDRPLKKKNGKIKTKHA